MPRKNPIKLGTRFSNLIVLKELPERSNIGTVRYSCLCDCGNTAVANGSDLRAGKHKSCGHLRHLPHRALPAGVAGFNTLYLNYRWSAKYRKVPMDLTPGQFRELTSSDCFYCGVKPYQESRSRADSKSKPYLYNGIDRIDNSKGYIIENCVACCGLCNRMKRDLSQENFLKHIHKVSQRFEV